MEPLRILVHIYTRHLSSYVQILSCWKKISSAIIIFTPYPVLFFLGRYRRKRMLKLWSVAELNAFHYIYLDKRALCVWDLIGGNEGQKKNNFPCSFVEIQEKLKNY
jgi:hypothetical protein